MGQHDQHLPKRPLDKQVTPGQTPNIDRATMKRRERGIALRRKDDAKNARARKR